MERKENITKILLLGETGVGKSSMGNYIVGKPKFLSLGSSKRVTTQIEGNISERELYKDIYIIDSPGSQDTQLEDSKYLEELQNNFQDINAGIRAICILINFSQPRFMSYLQKQIHIYCLLFPIEDFWAHVSIVFTKAYYYIPEKDFNSTKQELESEEGLINEIMNFIRKCTEEINKSKKSNINFKEIIIPGNLPIFYIDTNLNVNEKENTRTKEEIKKLIEWARKKEYLDFQNINKNKIDVNYLSSEKIEDIVINDEHFLEGSKEKLKIYIKKYFAQFKKKTFHNETVIIKDPKPYKIEEVKEEEKECPKVLISSPENTDYKIYKIEHKAIKSKKRVTENECTEEWKDIDNQSDLESRIISTDKIEEKTTYGKNLINSYKEGKKTIEIFNHFKLIQVYKNSIEQKNEETKQKIYTETITKQIIEETTEKKPFKRDMKYSEDIVREEILIEYDNGTTPKKETKEIERKKKYYKTINFDGEEYKEKIGFLIYTKVKEFKREDETDENGNIITKGEEEKTGERIINTEEERHIVRKENQIIYEEDTPYYEYRNINCTRTNEAARTSRDVGTGMFKAGAFLSFIPFIGLPLMVAGGTTAAVSSGFELEGYSQSQRRKITIKKVYSIDYNIYNDGTKEEFSKKFIEEMKNYGDWENY